MLWILTSLPRTTFKIQNLCILFINFLESEHFRIASTFNKMSIRGCQDLLNKRIPTINVIFCLKSRILFNIPSESNCFALTLQCNASLDPSWCRISKRSCICLLLLIAFLFCFFIWDFTTLPVCDSHNIKNRLEALETLSIW